jgi:hypothetical protein
MGGNIMTEGFTETLRVASEPVWSQAVGHRFVKELFAGTLPDAVMARYLVQDHRFLDSFLVLLGAALASADTFEARLRFGRFTADPDTQPTIGSKAIMREAAETRSYAAALAVLVVAEWLYFDWASRAPQPLPDNFVHAGWISCTTIRIFAASSSSCARSWTVSARRSRICATTSSGAPSRSSTPSNWAASCSSASPSSSRKTAAPTPA